MSVDNLSPRGNSAPRDDLVGGGEPPYDGSMESRVQRLEADIATIKADLAVVKSNYVTKADLALVESRLIRWTVGSALGLAVAGITVMTFVLNNAIPKAPMAPPPAPVLAPIVITVPYPQALPAPPQPSQK